VESDRALTQLYEEALRPLGLRASQLTILQVLSLAGEMTQGGMGQFLAMDSPTLTRTLAIMSRHGWITRRSPSACSKFAPRAVFDRGLRRLTLWLKNRVE
jgi:DNA-binding MarR family transcriptional regulator